MMFKLNSNGVPSHIERWWIKRSFLCHFYRKYGGAVAILCLNEDKDYFNKGKVHTSLSYLSVKLKGTES